LHNTCDTELSGLKGSCLVEIVPSPKVHFHDVGVSVLLSVKATVNRTFPEVGAPEKAATDETVKIMIYYLANLMNMHEIQFKFILHLINIFKSIIII